MRHLLTTLALMVCLAALATAWVGCDDDDDNDDDDTAVNDDDDDDDTSGDDDDDDDDDDDTVDDDTADDDTGDDDDDDNDDDDTTPTVPGVQIEMIAGGEPGHNGSALVRHADGNLSIATNRGRTVVVYHVTESEVTEAEIGFPAGPPDMVMDAAGHLHLAYEDLANDDLIYATDASGDWVAEVVESAGNVGEYPSVALGPDGEIHIAYRRETADSSMPEIRLARSTAKGWSLETYGPGILGRNSLAVDASGGRHIIYDNSEHHITYATDRSGAWQVHVIEPNFTTSRALAVDAFGHAYVAYSVMDSLFFVSSLYMATNANGTWTVGTVLWDSGSFLDAALDQAGHMHITADTIDDPYDSNYTLQHFEYDGTNWSWETIDPQINTGMYPALLVTADGGRYVAYGDEVDGELRLATETESGWSIRAVDTPGAPFEQGFVLDSDGYAHVSYIKSSSGGVWYATNQTGAWVNEPVDDTPGYGSYNSVALDPDGYAYVAYCGEMIELNWDCAELFLATNRTGEWVRELVTEDGGTHNSMAIGPDGTVHLLYQGRDLGDGPRYATNATGEWVMTDLDPAGGSGDDTAIQLDDAGAVHMTFNVWAYNDLKYATNATGDWVVEEISGYWGGAGMYNDFALDSQGFVRAAYYAAVDSIPGLAYADNTTTRDDDDWPQELVVADGFACDIDLTADDTVHIIYTNDRNVSLAYARGGPGNWEFFTVDSAGSVGWYPEMAIDRATGTLHTTYAGEGALWYARFPLTSPER